MHLPSADNLTLKGDQIQHYMKLKRIKNEVILKN